MERGCVTDANVDCEVDVEVDVDVEVGPIIEVLSLIVMSTVV